MVWTRTFMAAHQIWTAFQRFDCSPCCESHLHKVEITELLVFLCKHAGQHIAGCSPRSILCLAPDLFPPGLAGSHPGSFCKKKDSIIHGLFVVLSCVFFFYFPLPFLRLKEVLAHKIIWTLIAAENCMRNITHS